MNKPLISICIPTYNGEKYLQETLDSIKSQTYKNLEVIISDDQSKDKTLEICEKFRSEVDFPVFIFSHQPAGIGANWNYTIEKANGEYIKFVFQDDTMVSDCLTKMMTVFEKNAKMKFVACKRNFINNNTNIADIQIAEWISLYGNLQSQIIKEEKKTSIITKNIFKQIDFFERPFNKIGEPSTVLFKKDIVTTIGYFNTDLKQILDYEYWYRVLLKFDIVIINEQLVNFRIHDEQETNRNRSVQINDYEKYVEFQFRKLFLYLNRRKQKELLYRKYPILKETVIYYYRIITKLNTIVKSSIDNK